MATSNPYAAYQRYGNIKIDRTKNNHLNNNKNQMQDKSNNSNFPKYTSNGVSQYWENTIMTANPEELTLMLYDGAIKFLNQAKEYIKDKEIERTHISILRAQDIFSELMGTLNMEYEISENLYSIYSFISDNLMEVNIKKDTNLLSEMINITRELRETWLQAMQLMKKN